MTSFDTRTPLGVSTLEQWQRLADEVAKLDERLTMLEWMLTFLWVVAVVFALVVVVP